MSTDTASASLIIPMIRGLQKSSYNHVGDHGIYTIKTDMLSALRKRYAAVEDNSILSLATLLDPRFKDRLFSSAVQRNFVV